MQRRAGELTGVLRYKLPESSYEIEEPTLLARSAESDMLVRDERRDDLAALVVLVL